MAASPKRVGPQAGPQERFLRCDADVVIYGGQAGGGKTYGLLLDPLYYVKNPAFGAVIFRRTTKQVRNEGGLWDTATDLYPYLGATPNLTDLKYTFPTGSTVGFAHLEYEKNKLDWQGAQIPWIGFDELTHFTWSMFTYLLSRNRSVSGIPGKIRATCNPDPDHWVRRFIDWWIGDDGFPIQERAGVVRYFAVVNDKVVWADSEAELIEDYGDPDLPADHEEQLQAKSFTFIPATIYDNRILLKQDPGYLASLKALPRVEREQLLGGNWDVRPAAGLYYQRTYFPVVDAPPADRTIVRAWDLAGTEDRRRQEKREGKIKGPAFTASVKMSQCNRTGKYYVEHVTRQRLSPAKVKDAVRNIADQDGRPTKIRLSQDPGQAGKAQAHEYVTMLSDRAVAVRRETGSKLERQGPLSAQAEAGNVILVRGPWNDEFIAEMEAIPDNDYWDQADAAANAYDELQRKRRGSRVIGR